MRPAFYLPLAAQLLLAGCATTFHAGAPRGAIDVIAHRGASSYAPENTLASFRRAMELQADWFELDCLLTKDGEVLICHDDTVDRTTNGKGKIAELTLAELKQLDAGSWFDPKFKGEPLPTLNEALDLAKDKTGVYIEIKNCGDDGKLFKQLLDAAQGRKRMSAKLRAEFMRMIEASGTPNLELTRKVIAAVRARGMKDQVVLQSFSPVVCIVALAEAPELRTEFLGAVDKDNPERWTMFMAFNDLMGAKGANASSGSLNQDRIKGFHRQGKTVAVWTVDKESDMRRFAEWKVDAIITNHPDVCLRELKAMGKH
jgi:glycerophosphoryl diester phosphodiesterase